MTYLSGLLISLLIGTHETEDNAFLAFLEVAHVARKNLKNVTKGILKVVVGGCGWF